METLHVCLNGHAIVPRVPGGIWQIMESVKMKVSDRKERGKTGNAAIQDRGESDTDGRVPGEDWLGGGVGGGKIGGRWSQGGDITTQQESHGHRRGETGGPLDPGGNLRRLRHKKTFRENVEGYKAN